MSAFAVSIRRPDLLDDECDVCGWSRWMGLCGCQPNAVPLIPLSAKPVAAWESHRLMRCNAGHEHPLFMWDCPDSSHNDSPRTGQMLAEIGEEREEYGDPCGHRRGACSCEADDLAYFADEEL